MDFYFDLNNSKTCNFRNLKLCTVTIFKLYYTKKLLQPPNNHQKRRIFETSISIGDSSGLKFGVFSSVVYLFQVFIFEELYICICKTTWTNDLGEK